MLSTNGVLRSRRTRHYSETALAPGASVQQGRVGSRAWPLSSVNAERARGTGGDPPPPRCHGRAHDLSAGDRQSGPFYAPSPPVLEAVRPSIPVRGVLTVRVGLATRWRRLEAGREDRLTEGNTDRGMAVSIGALHPDDPPLPLRAERVFSVPVEHELSGRKTVPRLPLPAAIVHCRTHKVYAAIRTTRPEVVGGDIAHIDDLFPCAWPPLLRSGFDAGW
jgi:hypothetical protein